MNEKGILFWIKQKIDALLIFFHLKKRKEEEEKKEQEEIERRMRKPEIFGKFFLGFFLGVIEYAASRPKSKDIKELVDLDDIKEEIKNLEKKMEWLERKVSKERRLEKKKAYQNKLDHTKHLIKELEERTKLIQDNRKKAEEIKKKLERILVELEDMKKEVEQIKSHIETTKEPAKLQLYQTTLGEKQHLIQDKMNELEQIKKDYDRFADVDISLNKTEQRYLEEAHENEIVKVGTMKKEKTVKTALEEVPKILPLTRYLETEIVDTIVYTNKKAITLAKEVEKQTTDTKKQAKHKEEQERERIRKEAEEKLNAEVHEVELAEERINTHVQETNREIEKLRKQVDKVKKETTKQTTHFRGISKMIINVSKMAVGLLSFTFFKNPGVGLVVGSVILNNSIRGLRNGLRLNKRRITYYKYTDVTNEILKQKSTLKVSEKLMNDSLKQIALFKSEFDQKFEDRIKQLPEYQELMEKVDIVEREILEKQEMLNEQKKELNEVSKKNEKQKRKEKIKQGE